MVAEAGGGVAVVPGAVTTDPASTMSIERSRVPTHTAAANSGTVTAGMRTRSKRTSSGDVRLPLESYLLRDALATDTLSPLSPHIGSSPDRLRHLPLPLPPR